MSETFVALLAQTAQSTSAEPTATSGVMNLIVTTVSVLAIFILPFLFGNFLAKQLRMPTIGGRIGFATFVIAVTLFICIKAKFQLPMSIDISGGTILVYEIKKTPGEVEPVNADAVVAALQNRLNPSGTKDVSIRPFGESQIEVVVPNTTPFEVDLIKKSIKEAGQLKFRIVANRRDHTNIIQAARDQAASPSATLRDVYNADKQLIGQWYRVGRKDPKNGLRLLRTPVTDDVVRNAKTGQILQLPPDLSSEDNSYEKWLQKEGIDEIDVLMALVGPGGQEYVNVSGDDLASASFTFDSKGLPAVGFNLNTAGSSRMFQLTAANAPDGAFHRRMAIILDENVLSAPQLNSPISTNGIIEGNFTREEVEFVVSILRAGKLPAALSPAPISENRIGALLGATTIKKGTYASILSVVVTLLCLLVYYRFSGFVAAFALVLNGLMIWATMILIQQPLSLPGLAGLVLTLGMAVDANVLVFERMREEVAKGATGRMAIRNGFDRAFTTIVDSNLTTLIAAVVLYWIGTDQIRGFAVSLIIGILISMFTAVYCARIIFDVAEKTKTLSLGMSDGIAWLRRALLGDKDLDFMSWQKFNIGVSLLLIVIGLAAVAYRGRNFLAIDFVGGTSVTVQLAEAMEADKLREITREIFDVDSEGQRVESTLQRMEQEPLNTVFKIDTSFQDVNELKTKLVGGLAKHPEVKLVTYLVETQVASKSEKLGSRSGSGVLRYVAMQDKDAKPAEDKPAEVKPSEAKPVEEKPAEATPATPADKPAEDKSADAKPAANAPAETKPAETTPAETKPAAEITANPQEPAAATPPQVTSVLTVSFSKSESDSADSVAKMNIESLSDYVLAAATKAGVPLTSAQLKLTPDPIPEDWTPASVAGAGKWNIELPLDAENTKKIADALKTNVESEPVWLSISNIGNRVARDMKEKAVAAFLVSLIFIIVYIWFRFQKLSYGLAAVIALLHDVLITLGIVAICHWLAGPLNFLMIEDFKIDLIMVAAFLTIIGYSLNDTIVVFDRIREVRGKSPRLTTEMVNTSVNQTLSRTLLTSSTTLLTIALLYFFGGEGIHGFSFALFVGIVVGTYSSIFIASPVLLWIANRQQAAATPARRMESRPVA